MSASALRTAAAEASDGLLRCPPGEVKGAGPGNLLAVVWRQWRTERALRARGVDFRSADPVRVEAAYAAMSAEEFDAINGRQAWANWRTIPASLDGLLPVARPDGGPLRAVDLGCGTGGSTAVLAYCLPDGSEVTGVEFAAPLVAVARRRQYPNRTGRCTVRFVEGSAVGPLTDADGAPLADGSLDLVNSSGVIGHHLTGGDLNACLDETARVLRPGGVAALDPGPCVSADRLTERATARGLRRQRRTRSNPLDRCGQVVFVRE
ncbi:class I SAM-dependent methyltransferase [Alienimonas sp. DA493]|uniref:class I SAM-dependent methyltransferase n=1 Tax=Alienimonas sp. DA493 TaxID=3373605 RepID=UPI00375478ED